MDSVPDWIWLKTILNRIFFLLLLSIRSNKKEKKTSIFFPFRSDLSGRSNNDMIGFCNKSIRLMANPVREEEKKNWRKIERYGKRMYSLVSYIYFPSFCDKFFVSFFCFSIQKKNFWFSFFGMEVGWKWEKYMYVGCMQFVDEQSFWPLPWVEKKKLHGMVRNIRKVWRKRRRKKKCQYNNISSKTI